MRHRPIAIAVSLLTVAGCGGDDVAARAGWSEAGAAALEQPPLAAKKARAVAARDALAAALMARLQQEIESGGTAAAVSVCSSEAPQIAGRIAREHEVRIGRTSFRLRNQSSTPPTWAARHVARRTETEVWVRDGDRLGALLPIRTQERCVACHGARESLAPEVATMIDRLYPSDRATGFAEGELRGWFWVEVD